MKSSVFEEDFMWEGVLDSVVPYCHACQAEPVGGLSLKEAHEKCPPNCCVTIGRKSVRLCEYHAKSLISMLQQELNKEHARKRADWEGNCPICGTSNKRDIYTEEGIGVVEEHYFCPECGYSDQMCYSPGFSTIVKGKGRTYWRRLNIRLKNWKKTLRVRLADDFCAKAGKLI